MTGGDIAGLIAAGVFAVLVALLAVPIMKLGRVFDELRILIRDLNDETEPLLQEVTRTVATTNSQLEKVDVITDSVSDASAHVSAMTSLVASTVGQPIIKTAAFSSGVRRALSADAVRARREERRRVREAEEAAGAAEPARTAEAPEAPEPGAEPAAQPPADPILDDGGPAAAPGRSAAANFRTSQAHAPVTEPRDPDSGPWWEGTEWDSAGNTPQTEADAPSSTVGDAIMDPDDQAVRGQDPEPRTPGGRHA